MGGDFSTLSRFLHQADWRRRQQEVLDWLPRSLAAVLTVALGVAVISRAQPLLTRTEIALLTAALLLVVVTFMVVIIILRRRTLVEQARFADRQFQLRERASTAIEIHHHVVLTSPELAARQLQDALATTSGIDLPRRMPFTVRPRDWVLVFSTLGLLLFLLWQPNRQELLLLEQRALAATVAQQTEALEAVAQSIADNENLTAEQQAALQQPVDEALNMLSGQDVSREEAVAALSEAEAQLRGLEAQFDNQALSEALSRSAAALAQNESGASLGEALRDNRLEAAGQAAVELAEELPNLDHGSQQDLAQSLTEAAAQLQSADSDMAGRLQEAAESLAEGDIAAAQEALRETAASLQEAAQDQTAAAQAGQAAAALGEARQEVAQAGGQAETGSGETVGANGSGAESGAAAESGGDDPTGAANQQGTGDGQEPGAGGPSQGGGRTENVFVPTAVDLSSTTGTDVELPVQCLGDPAACGPAGEPLPTDPNDPAGAGGSTVPYERVFGVYRQTANEALRRGDIPLGLQGLVREYFAALEP